MNSTRRTLIIALAILAVAVIGYPLTVRALRKPEPKLLASADFIPTDVTSQGAAWFWIERPIKAKERLFRASASGKEALVEADEIAGYSTEGDSVVWAARTGKAWRLARRTGGREETILEGQDAIGKPLLTGGKIYWGQRSAGQVSSAAPLPALGPTVELKVSDGAGLPRTIARLVEPQCDVIGVRGDSVFVACHRTEAGAQTALYDVSLANGRSRRIAGEEGASRVVLLENGDVAWTGFGRDNSSPTNSASVRSVTPGGKTVTRADWLPNTGALYSQGNKIYYVGGVEGTLWEVTTHDEMARQIETPSGYLTVGLGSSELLLKRYTPGGDGARLFTAPRP